MEVSGTFGAAGAWRIQRKQTLANLMRCIDAAEAAVRVERDLAETLRALAPRDEEEGAARLLKLAEDADRRAQAAAMVGGRLRRRARQLAGHPLGC